MRQWQCHVNPRFQEFCQLQIGHVDPGLVTFFLSFRDQLPYPAVALLVPGRFILGQVEDGEGWPQNGMGIRFLLRWLWPVAPFFQLAVVHGFIPQKHSRSRWLVGLGCQVVGVVSSHWVLEGTFNWHTYKKLSFQMGVCAVFLGCCYILFQTWSLLKPPQIRATGHAACNLMANVGRVLAPLLVSNSERTVKVVDSEAQAFFFSRGSFMAWAYDSRVPESWFGRIWQLTQRSLVCIDSQINGQMAGQGER